MYKKLNSPTSLQIISILLIIAFISILYFPSLTHPPRSDQWSFLVDTIDNHTAFDTFKNSYSYNRTRVIAIGDTALFRPLLFLLLSLEKGIFGNNFRFIQAIGIMLHILVVLLLFIIMNQIRGILKINENKKMDMIFATLGILFISFFALNFSFTEIVIWTHLHAYMVFHVLTLLSFILLLKYIYIPDGESPYKWIIPLSVWFFTLLGSFMYEFGQICALLIGIFFFVLLRKRTLKHALLIALAFLMIPVIYQTANLIDLHIHRDLFEPDLTASMIAKEVFSLNTVTHGVRLLRYFVILPFFPSLTQVSSPSRTIISELSLEEIGPLALPSLLAFISWWLFVCLGIIAIRKSNSRKFNLFFMLILFFYLGYCTLIVLGRLNLRPYFDQVVMSGTYYLYLPLCYATIITLILTGVVVSRDYFINNKYLWCAKYALLFSMPIVIFSSALNIQTIVRGHSYESGNTTQIVDSIEDFLDHHPDSKISFSINHSERISAIFGIPFTTILFKKFEDNINPDYVITFKSGRAVFTPTSEYRSIYGLKAEEDIAPTLVRIGTTQQIYIYNGKYLGIPHKANLADSPFFVSKK